MPELSRTAADPLGGRVRAPRRCGPTPRLSATHDRTTPALFGPLRTSLWAAAQALQLSRGHQVALRAMPCRRSPMRCAGRTRRPERGWRSPASAPHHSAISSSADRQARAPWPPESGGAGRAARHLAASAASPARRAVARRAAVRRGAVAAARPQPRRPLREPCCSSSGQPLRPRGRRGARASRANVVSRHHPAPALHVPHRFGACCSRPSDLLLQRMRKVAGGAGRQIAASRARTRPPRGASTAWPRSRARVRAALRGRPPRSRAAARRGRGRQARTIGLGTSRPRRRLLDHDKYSRAPMQRWSAQRRARVCSFHKASGFARNAVERRGAQPAGRPRGGRPIWAGEAAAAQRCTASGLLEYRALRGAAPPRR